MRRLVEWVNLEKTGRRASLNYITGGKNVPPVILGPPKIGLFEGGPLFNRRGPFEKGAPSGKWASLEREAPS